MLSTSPSRSRAPTSPPASPRPSTATTPEPAGIAAAAIPGLRAPLQAVAPTPRPPARGHAPAPRPPAAAPTGPSAAAPTGRPPCARSGPSTPYSRGRAPSPPRRPAAAAPSPPPAPVRAQPCPGPAACGRRRHSCGRAHAPPAASAPPGGAPAPGRSHVRRPPAHAPAHIRPCPPAPAARPAPQPGHLGLVISAFRRRATRPAGRSCRPRLIRSSQRRAVPWFDGDRCSANH